MIWSDPSKGEPIRKKYLLVMVDKFTKWIEAKPVKTAESGPVIDFISGFGRFNWFGFYPLGEFVHHDQQIFFLMASSFKGSDHIQSPDRKRPSDGDCL